MSKAKKAQSVVGKMIYIPLTDTFHKCTAQNEDNQPIAINVDGEIRPLRVGQAWVIANNRSKVIKALLAALQAQAMAIDQQATVIREQQLDLEQFKNK